MLFFNANFICYYFYPTKKREEPKIFTISYRIYYDMMRIYHNCKII